MGHHGLIGSHHFSDHCDLLQPSRYKQRHAFFRTVPILPETNGRVAQIYVDFSGAVRQGDPIFKLDSSTQEAAVETAKRKIAEEESELVVAKADMLKFE